MAVMAPALADVVPLGATAPRLRPVVAIPTGDSLSSLSRFLAPLQGGSFFQMDATDTPSSAPGALWDVLPDLFGDIVGQPDAGQSPGVGLSIPVDAPAISIASLLEVGPAPAGPVLIPLPTQAGPLLGAPRPLDNPNVIVTPLPMAAWPALGLIAGTVGLQMVRRRRLAS